MRTGPKLPSYNCCRTSPAQFSTLTAPVRHNLLFSTLTAVSNCRRKENIQKTRRCHGVSPVTKLERSTTTVAAFLNAAYAVYKLSTRRQRRNNTLVSKGMPFSKLCVQTLQKATTETSLPVQDVQASTLWCHQAALLKEGQQSCGPLIWYTA